MVGRNFKCLVVFQCSICDMHFGILKDELISGISVGYSSLIQLNVNPACSPTKRKISTIFFRKLHILSEET